MSNLEAVSQLCQSSALRRLVQEVMGLRDKRTRALATSSNLALSAAAQGFVALLGEEPQAFPEV